MSAVPGMRACARENGDRACPSPAAEHEQVDPERPWVLTMNQLSRLLTLLSVSALLAQVACSQPAGDPGLGCQKDTDCKADRVCDNGKCGPPTNAAHAATSSAVIRTDPLPATASVTPVTSAPACPPCPACNASPTVTAQAPPVTPRPLIPTATSIAPPTPRPHLAPGEIF